MGSWSDALSRAFGERAPELAHTLLQSLKDHKSGKKKLSAGDLRIVRGLLRKLMSPSEIEDELATVEAAPVKRQRKAKAKAKKSQR